jgi:hypothetical protein
MAKVIIGPNDDPVVIGTPPSTGGWYYAFYAELTYLDEDDVLQTVNIGLAQGWDGLGMPVEVYDTSQAAFDELCASEYFTVTYKLSEYPDGPQFTYRVFKSRWVSVEMKSVGKYYTLVEDE